MSLSTRSFRGVAGPACRVPVLAVAGAILAAAAATTDVEAAKSMRFRHGLAPSTSYDMVSQMEVKIQADMGALDVAVGEEKKTVPAGTAVPGEAPGTEKPAGADAAPAEAAPTEVTVPAHDEPILMEMRQKLTMRSVLKVGARAADGALPLECNIQDLSGTIELAGQEFPVPGLSDDVRNSAGFRGRLLAGGREVQVETAGLDELPPDTQQMLSQLLQVLPTFPDGKLKVGDSFENPVKFELPGLPTGGELDAGGSVKYTLTSIDKDQASFDTHAVLSAHAVDSAEGANTTISGHLDGVAVFNLADGIFTDHRATLSLELLMDMELPPQGQPGDAKGGAPAVTKITAKATGPVEIKMTRQGAPKS